MLPFCLGAPLNPLLLGGNLPTTSINVAPSTKTAAQEQKDVVVRALREIAETKEREKAAEAASAKDRSSGSTKRSTEASERLRCHLHKKPNSKCRKCQQIQAAEEAARAALEGTQQNLEQSEFAWRHFFWNPELQEQLKATDNYKSMLATKSVGDLVRDICQQQTQVCVHDASNAGVPSRFICYVYRLAVLLKEKEELLAVVDNTESAMVRCVGLFYTRVVFSPGELWSMFEEFLLDDMKLSYTIGSESVTTTIGEYTGLLLTSEKYFDTQLPLIPVKLQKEWEEKLAPLPGHRERMRSNRRILVGDAVYGIPVAVCMDGVWLEGEAQQLVEASPPTRTRVSVWLNNGMEMEVHIGKVQIKDYSDPQQLQQQQTAESRTDPCERRSRSRSRGLSR